MRVGIGVTSYNRPECLKECLEHINKHTFMDNVTLYVAQDTDEDRQGIAKRKNECLRALKDCDYVFLFDDDCFPIKDGWMEFFINSGNSHLLFLNDKLHNPFSSMNGRTWYKNCGGVFMFMDKETILRVGGFNEKFFIYGFEHAEYSIRILGKHGIYPALNYTDEYLFAHDYSTTNHKSSITDEEKKQHVRNNWDKFFKESITQIYLPL
jgi:GT2 family glycosyltransferase